jgi:outer membrane protein OmpA-like peptidoglycan-associated protein
MKVGERLLNSELKVRKILWLGAAIGAEVAICLQLVPSVLERQGNGVRTWAFVLVVLLVLAGIAIYFSIAVFGTAADTARHLIDEKSTNRYVEITEPSLTKDQVNDLTPPRYAELAGMALPLLVLLTAPVLVVLAFNVIFSDTMISEPVTEITLELRPPGPPVVPPGRPETNVAIEILRDDLVLLSEFDVVYFDLDSDKDPEIPTQVNRIADRIRGRSNDWPCEILVYGHADSQGSDQHNVGLSKRRVDRVVDLLSERLPDIPIRSAPAGGERQLKILTDDEVDEWANRRVDVSVRCRK